MKNIRLEVKVKIKVKILLHSFKEYHLASNSRREHAVTVVNGHSGVRVHTTQPGVHRVKANQNGVGLMKHD